MSHGVTEQAERASAHWGRARVFLHHDADAGPGVVNFMNNRWQTPFSWGNLTVCLWCKDRAAWCRGHRRRTEVFAYDLQTVWVRGNVCAVAWGAWLASAWSPCTDWARQGTTGQTTTAVSGPQVV